MRAKVVIVGGGFAGLAAAKRLRKAPVDVLLIDKNNYHLFQPLLYQVATGGLNPSDIAQPIRRVFRKQKNVTVLMEEVTRIALADKKVHVASGREIAFDFLIVAAGLRTSYFGHGDWQLHSPGLKNITDALEIRRRTYLAYEQAETIVARDPRADISHLLTFCVVGGGATGVELAGALREIGLQTLQSDFRSIDPTSVRVVLLEGGPRLLPGMSGKISRKVRARLEKTGVEVRLNTRVTHVGDTGLETTAEKIAANTVLWAAGVEGVPLTSHTDAPIDSRGRLKVHPDLSLPGCSDAFAVGDLALMRSNAGREIPAVAQAAVQSGTHAAENIIASLHKRPRTHFHYRDKGAMAAIGRNAAAVQTGRVQSVGFFAWIIWWLLHIYFLVGHRNRFFVFLAWVWSYVTFGRGARLVTEVAYPRTRTPAEGANVSKDPHPSGHSDQHQAVKSKLNT